MLVLIGASASGKTETAKELMAEGIVKKIVTCTTRPPRKGERDGVDYHFLSLDAFREKEREGKFLETAFYAGNWYGTLKADVGDGKVACVDPAGAKSYRDYLKDDMFCIYLDASEQMRAKRMREKRKDSPQAVEERLEKDRAIFTPEVKKLADLSLDTDPMSVKDSAKAVAEAYRAWLKSHR